MNSKVLLIALLGLLTAFSACNTKQEEDIYQPILPIPLIKTMTVYDFEGGTTVSSFEYDELNRIIYYNENGQYFEDYHYINDSVIVKETHFGVPQSEDEFRMIDSLYLSEESLCYARRTLRDDMYGQYDPSLTIERSFEYNSENYLVKSTLVNMNLDEISEIMDGNTVKRSYSNSYFEYEFLPATANTIGHENMGKPWMGKQDKNLVSKQSGFSEYNEGQEPPHMDYAYEFDSQRRVSKQTIVNSGTYTVFTYY